MSSFRAWRQQRQCFHHDHGGNPANTRPAISWIKQQIIDMGRRKMFWCDRCGRTWFV
jgi:hypothetical protein